MVRTDDVYQKYVSVLEEELLPAMGCTEPIAIAYAAAKAREVLGDVPERVFLAALLPERRISSSRSLLPLHRKRLRRLRNT